MGKVNKCNIVGTSHYLDNILSLKSENLDYDLKKSELIGAGYENETIYQYDFLIDKFELVPEPDNKYDPNAIKVLADGVLIGYIKTESCRHILKVLQNNRVFKIDGYIAGGKYKYLAYDEDTEIYSLTKDESEYFVTIYLTEKD